MATNFEFYRDEILAISEEEKGIALVSNKPVPCEDIDCTACYFKGDCSEYRLIQWLYAEHIEQPKLTKRERAFCEAVQTGWIARDESGELYWYPEDEKTIQKIYQSWRGEEYVCISDMKLDFSFIKWENEKPWAVEDLLKLEVQEDA